MRAYALRRLLLLVPTLIGISLLAFGLIKLAPGDAAAEFLRRTTDRPPTDHRAMGDLPVDDPSPRD